MKLSKASIGEFKELAKKELGLELTDGEAEESAVRLITLVRAIVENQPQRERGPP